MEIERIGPGELAVRFGSNPSAVDAQDWLNEFRGQLDGSETMVRVDVTTLPVLSSLGVSVVVGIYRLMDKQGGTICVTAASESVRRVFDLFKLTGLFEVRLMSS